MTNPTLPTAGVAELLARVEAATGPDRELDRELARALGWHNVDENPWTWGFGSQADIIGMKPQTAKFFPVDPFTSSLDAAIALCEQEFPGPFPLAEKCAIYITRRFDGQWLACVSFPATPDGPPSWSSAYREGATAPLAALAALLKAKANLSGAA